MVIFTSYFFNARVRFRPGASCRTLPYVIIALWSQNCLSNLFGVTTALKLCEVKRAICIEIIPLCCFYSSIQFTPHGIGFYWNINLIAVCIRFNMRGAKPTLWCLIHFHESCQLYNYGVTFFINLEYWHFCFFWENGFKINTVIWISWISIDNVLESESTVQFITMYVNLSMAYRKFY